MGLPLDRIHIHRQKLIGVRQGMLQLVQLPAQVSARTGFGQVRPQAEMPGDCALEGHGDGE